MITDCELLRFAAKAFGINTERSLQYADGAYDWPGQAKRWEPHIDDGDALRLAVHLNLGVYICYGVVIIVDLPNEHPSVDCVIDGDPYAATRRAIVLAAAYIGKNMK